MAAEVEPRFLLSEISDLPNLKRLSFTDDLLDTDGHPGFRRESRLFARTTVPISLQPPPGRPPQLPYISQWRYSTGIGTPERSVDVSATAHRRRRHPKSLDGLKDGCEQLTWHTATSAI